MSGSSEHVPAEQAVLDNALVALGESVDRVLALGLWQLDSAGLTRLVEVFDVETRRLAAVSLEAISDAEGRGVPAESGASSTSAWVRDRLGCRPGDAGRTAALARSLRTQQCLNAALRRGEALLAHAHVISSGVRALPVISTSRPATKPRRCWSSRPPGSTRVSWHTRRGRFGFVWTPAPAASSSERKKPLTEGVPSP